MSYATVSTGQSLGTVPGAGMTYQTGSPASQLSQADAEHPGRPFAGVDRTREAVTVHHACRGCLPGGHDPASRDHFAAGVRTVISIESVTRKYGAFTAVDDVSFTADAGRVTGFLGPNGAGKSTTMRIVVGLTRAHSG